MSEFFRVRPPQQALEELLQRFPPMSGVETAALEQSRGRVLASDIVAPHDAPAFARSARDGYAVRAADTTGASQGIPCELQLIGEVKMGTAPALHLQSGQAALIHTGGMMPEGADAVAMIENCEPMTVDRVAIFRPVAPGEYVVQAGEDWRAGDRLLAAGTILRPEHLGALASVGILQVQLRPRPRVAILAQGDEIVAREAQPAAGQVRDVHLTMLAALSRACGAEALLSWPVLPDQEQVVGRAAREALAAADVLVLTAGSSVSIRDLTARVVSSLGRPGIIFHGLAMKPGKPTLAACCSGKAVFGLPGNPVSAAVVFRRLVVPFLWHLQGARPPRKAMTSAVLTRNVPSETGREDWVPVVLREGHPPQAVPLFGSPNSIGLLSRADGLLAVPLEKTGLEAGSNVSVELW